MAAIESSVRLGDSFRSIPSEAIAACEADHKAAMGGPDFIRYANTKAQLQRIIDASPGRVYFRSEPHIQPSGLPHAGKWVARWNVVLGESGAPVPPEQQNLPTIGSLKQDPTTLPRVDTQESAA